MTEDIGELCESKSKMKITELIGLGETQRKIYDGLKNNPEIFNGALKDAYELHQKELELLIKYQNERTK